MPTKNKVLIVILATILFINFYLYKGLTFAQLIDKVIAIVNEEIITAQDLQRRIMSFKISPGFENLSREDWDSLIESAINRLIQELLILQVARLENMQIEEEDIEKRMESIRRNFPDEQAFLTALDKNNLTLNQLKKHYRREMLIDKVISLKIKRTIQIHPMEITNFYLENKKEFKEPSLVRARHIFIKVEDEETREERLSKIYVLYALLNKGVDFGTVAFNYSDGPNAEQYGDMGYVLEGELLKELDEFIFSLELGQLSEVIDTDYGYHIVKIEGKKPGRIKSISEVSNEIERILFQKKAEQKFQTWINDLKKDAYIWIK